MFANRLMDIMQDSPSAESLWKEGYKIPWHEPGFSRRMLREHLSQDHELASRRCETIAAQAAWLKERFLAGGVCRVLDLGCGPGLYAPHLTEAGHFFRGMDISPASIDYAQANFAAPGRCEFALGDVCRAEYGQGFGLVMMLYGELNVFPPEDCARILAAARQALAPGGRLFLEVQTVEAVQKLGRGHTWYKSRSGLFSERPHLCLVENHWYADQAVALQIFYVVDLASGGLQTYCNTTQAYEAEALPRLLKDAGFGEAEFHADWPAGNSALMALSAVKK
jgi:SAM-dependent methyltransferase